MSRKHRCQPRLVQKWDSWRTLGQVSFQGVSFSPFSMIHQCIILTRYMIIATETIVEWHKQDSSITSTSSLGPRIRSVLLRKGVKVTSASIGPHSHLVSSLRMPCRSLTRVHGMLLLVSPISQSVLQVHSHYQSEFSTQRDLALPLSVSSILFFP
jgi:hypothetical protein